MSTEAVLQDKIILVVDDEPDVLETVGEMLDMCQWIGHLMVPMNRSRLSSRWSGQTPLQRVEVDRLNRSQDVVAA